MTTKDELLQAIEWYLLADKRLRNHFSLKKELTQLGKSPAKLMQEFEGIAVDYFTHVGEIKRKVMEYKKELKHG